MKLLDDLRRIHRGEIINGELLLTCGVCHRRALGIRLGDKTGRNLIASCLSPKCKGRASADILQAYSLPTTSLPPALLPEVKAYLGERNIKSSDTRCSPVMRDLVYRSWLKASPLRQEGSRRLLETYRLPPAWLKLNGYGEHPNAKVKSVLEKEFSGELLSTVPGWVGGKGSALNDPAYSGILIPCRDVSGLIVALKIRLFREGGNKLMLLASPEVKAEYTVHVPLGVGTASKEVGYYTEGELKADYLWSVSRLPCVGIPGVNGV